MRGLAGEYKVGHAVVAHFRGWSIEHDILDAPDADVDDMWANEPDPRTVRLTVGNSVWTWRDVELLSLRPVVSVRLHGNPEKRAR